MTAPIWFCGPAPAAAALPRGHMRGHLCAKLLFCGPHCQLQWPAGMGTAPSRDRRTRFANKQRALRVARCAEVAKQPAGAEVQVHAHAFAAGVTQGCGAKLWVGRVAVALQLLVPFLEEPRIELLALAAGPAPRELRVSAPPPRPRSRAHEQRVVLVHTHMLLASVEAGRLPSRSLCLLAAASIVTWQALG